MEEFLKQNYRTLTFSVEILAVVFGILSYKKYKHTTAKYFIYFLIYVLFVDCIGNYPFYVKEYKFLSNINAIIKGTVFEKNKWWYTIFWRIGSILFFTFYYSKIVKNHIRQKAIKYFGIIFLITSLFTLIYNRDVFFTSSFPLITIMGAVIVVLCVTFYFIDILFSNEILKFYKSINFYISSAILLWWLIITPILFFDIYHNQSDWDFVFLKWQIFLFVNFFMYITFTIGLIVSKPDKK